MICRQYNCITILHDTATVDEFTASWGTKAHGEGFAFRKFPVRLSIQRVSEAEATASALRTLVCSITAKV